MNVTATGTYGAGYYTLYAAQTPRYDVSNLNTVSGQTVANHAITRVSNRGVACFSSAVGHVICDITGWFTGSPMSATTAPAFNPPPPPAAVPWVVQVPRLGLGQWVLDGDAKRIVDSGNTWHWTGTGLVGQGANIVMFGHRTSAGGPYRNLHLLQGGDLMYVTTSDGRRYTYQMVAEFITSKNPNDILAACGRVGGETVSLVACSKPNRLPTSLEYRLISTFQLVGWEDLG
jgi:sortase (surface protein transpeptidase)